MNKEKNYNENYEHLKSLLSYGDITNIANNTGFCRGTIYNVLNGRSNNDQILSEIVKNIEKKEQLLEKIHILLSEKRRE